MRSFPPWLVFVAVMAVSVGVNRAICLGCVDRHRGNRTCEWTGDTAFPVDVRNPAHWEHLVGDAQLAEELAIRYADTEFARRYGGAPGHGGLLDQGRVRNGCMNRLVPVIQQSHSVTAEQVERARAGRNPIRDAVVLLLFCPIYVVFARPASRLVENAVPAEARALAGAGLRLGVGRRECSWIAILSTLVSRDGGGACRQPGWTYEQLPPGETAILDQPECRAVIRGRDDFFLLVAAWSSRRSGAAAGAAEPHRGGLSLRDEGALGGRSVV